VTDEFRFSGCSALFIGAHPDDIEIGAGGTVVKMIRTGWDVGYCVVTSEADPAVAQIRKSEARAAAAILGIQLHRITFLDFPDTIFRPTGEAVDKLRQVLANMNFDPDLVLTHTLADSHNDHRGVHEFVRAVFRRKPILSFAVVNSLVSSEFTPRIFVEVETYKDAKLKALRTFQSQAGRINEKNIELLCQTFSANLGLAPQTEAFEFLLQEGSEDLLYLVLSLNDCPFHNLWYPLLREQPLALIHSVPPYRKKKDWNWPMDKEREGIEYLYKTFSIMWHDRHPIESFSSDSPHLDRILNNYNLLLAGSGASNKIIRDYFDHFRGLRYVITYFMPDYTDLAIQDRISNKKIFASYANDEFENRQVLNDIGILTIMPNPLKETRMLIGCMGIHGFGTLGAIKIISDRSLIQSLLDLVDLPLRDRGIQILVDHNLQRNRISIRKESLHIIGLN